jgi:hypothetical protein
MIEVGATGTAFEPYEKGTNISLPRPSTIYGGNLNVETGVLTVNQQPVTLDDMTWGYAHNRWYCSISPNAKYVDTTTVASIVASCYTADTAGNVYGGATANTISIEDGNLITVYNGSSVTQPTGSAVYELATPYEIQLTPQQVSLLQGANVITSNGTTISLTYREGVIATLADVESLAETINKVAEIADGDKSADQIIAGTFKGSVKANPTAMANLGTAQVRDIYFSDTEVVIGSVSTDPEGTLRITYR